MTKEKKENRQLEQEISIKVDDERERKYVKTYAAKLHGWCILPCIPQRKSVNPKKNTANNIFWFQYIAITPI